jgi:hypothetical protein
MATQSLVSESLGVTFTVKADGSVSVELPFPFGSRTVTSKEAQELKAWFDANLPK